MSWKDFIVCSHVKVSCFDPTLPPGPWLKQPWIHDYTCMWMTNIGFVGLGISYISHVKLWSPYSGHIINPGIMIWTILNFHSLRRNPRIFYGKFGFWNWPVVLEKSKMFKLTDGRRTKTNLSFQLRWAKLWFFGESRDTLPCLPVSIWSCIWINDKWLRSWLIFIKSFDPLT